MFLSPFLTPLFDMLLDFVFFLEEKSSIISTENVTTRIVCGTSNTYIHFPQKTNHNKTKTKNKKQKSTTQKQKEKSTKNSKKQKVVLFRVTTFLRDQTSTFNIDPIL